MNRGEIFKYYDDDTVIKTLRLYTPKVGFYSSDVLVMFYDMTDDRRRVFRETHKAFLSVYDRINKKA